MKYVACILRAWGVATALLLLGGCVAADRHAWQVSPDAIAEMQGGADWPLLPSSDYAAVREARKAEAVELLEDHEFVALDESQVADFAPDLPQQPEGGPVAYLVRGMTHGSPPAVTELRFDAATRRLFVQQFTWDGEMLLPYAPAGPNALVVRLPYAPRRVYPQAVRGGDWIFRGRD